MLKRVEGQHADGAVELSGHQIVGMDSRSLRSNSVPRRTPRLPALPMTKLSRSAGRLFPAYAGLRGKETKLQSRMPDIVLPTKRHGLRLS
jgi:hypothetical protein